MKIEVVVKTGARQDRVIPITDTDKDSPFLKIEVKAPARDGKANAALIKLLAKHFGVPQAAIKIKRGAASRRKLVDIV